MRFAVVLVLLAAACADSDNQVIDLGPSTNSPGVGPAAGSNLNPRLLRRFKALAPVAGVEGAPSDAQVALGKMLYFDRRLSADRTVACSTCHPLDRYGTDHAITSTGVGHLKGTRNAPSVFNSAGLFTQFWDGRAADLVEQAKAPILNPREMAMPSREAAVAAIAGVHGYDAPFRAAFPGDLEPITFDHIVLAIAAFERTLSTPSRWDRFLGGESTALTAEELDGVKLFADLGCVQCHTGALLGGTMFQRAGLQVPWPNQTDQGRYEITHVDADRMEFKVPSLRNVAATGPYFHDGSVATLDEAVRTMAHHQLGLELTGPETHAIVAFLGALTGEIPSSAKTPPVLPD
jgi:cytochrome c peroxidase